MAPIRPGQKLTQRSAVKEVVSRELPRSAGMRVAACRRLTVRWSAGQAPKLAPRQPGHAHRHPRRAGRLHHLPRRIAAHRLDGLGPAGGSRLAAPTRAPANQGRGCPQGPGSGRAARYVLTTPAKKPGGAHACHGQPEKRCGQDHHSRQPGGQPKGEIAPLRRHASPSDSLPITLGSTAATRRCGREVDNSAGGDGSRGSSTTQPSRCMVCGFSPIRSLHMRISRDASTDPFSACTSQRTYKATSRPHPARSHTVATGSRHTAAHSANSRAEPPANGQSGVGPTRPSAGSPVFVIAVFFRRPAGFGGGPYPAISTSSVAAHSPDHCLTPDPSTPRLTWARGVACTYFAIDCDTQFAKPEVRRAEVGG